MQALEDLFHVILDRRLAQVQLAGDFAVGQALRHQVQHVGLRGAERRGLPALGGRLAQLALSGWA